jgi:hypothetical protein
MPEDSERGGFSPPTKNNGFSSTLELPPQHKASGSKHQQLVCHGINSHECNFAFAVSDIPVDLPHFVEVVEEGKVSS